MQRSSVLLPQPLGPNSVKNEPFAISNVTSSSAAVALPGNFLQSPAIQITTFSSFVRRDAAPAS